MNESVILVLHPTYTFTYRSFDFALCSIPLIRCKSLSSLWIWFIISKCWESVSRRCRRCSEPVATPRLPNAINILSSRRHPIPNRLQPMVGGVRAIGCLSHFSCFFGLKAGEREKTNWLIIEFDHGEKRGKKKCPHLVLLNFDEIKGGFEAS